MKYLEKTVLAVSVLLSAALITSGIVIFAAGNGTKAEAAPLSESRTEICCPGEIHGEHSHRCPEEIREEHPNCCPEEIHGEHSDCCPGEIREEHSSRCGRKGRESHRRGRHCGNP